MRHIKREREEGRREEKGEGKETDIKGERENRTRKVGRNGKEEKRKRRRTE